MKFTIPPILSKSLLKIAANAFLSVGCLLMVSCDGGLLALGANEAFDNDSNSSSSNDDSNSSSSNDDSNSSSSEQGLAPIAINGISIKFIDSGVVANVAENGVDWYTVRVDAAQGSLLADGNAGTLTYEASGDKGIIEYVSRFDGDDEKVTLTFTSESTGTYVITADVVNETGLFTLIDTSQLEAPSSIAGLTIRYDVVDGSGEFSSEGSSTEVYGEDGETFTSRDGDGFTSGSFTYSASGNIGDFVNTRIQEFDFEGGQLLREFEVDQNLLTFLTGTTGTFAVSLSDSGQVGTFEIISGP